MPNYKIVFINDSFIKPSTAQSSTIDPRLLNKKVANQVIQTPWVRKEPVGSHIACKQGFIFQHHVEVQADFPSVDIKHYPLYNQRIFKGDRNKDGRPDWMQTCNVHSVACVLSGLTRDNVSPSDVYSAIEKFKGSIYAHDALVRAINNWGFSSKFSTLTDIEDAKAHLAKGKPIIWSNKLTHGGHIVSLLAYCPKEKKFLVFDPYGEPTHNGTKWVYNPVSVPYWLSENGVNRANMNRSGATQHWMHLVG